MQAISRLSLQYLVVRQGSSPKSEAGDWNGALEKRYELTASGSFVRFVWADWPLELSQQLAAEVGRLHKEHPELEPVQKGSEDWVAITRGWEADFESAEVIGRAYNESFDNAVSWVKSARDSRGRIGATCRVEGVTEFSLQLSWRGPVITQFGLAPTLENRTRLQKAHQQILTWAAGRIQPILDILKEKLTTLYGDRFRGLYVFGSYARPDAGVDLGIDSDLDVALLLSDFGSPYDERARVGEIVADLSLAHDIVISLIPIREQDFKDGNTNFARVISEYAIPV